MTPAAILSAVSQAGGSLWVTGDRLQYEAPAELPDELRAVLREHKPALVRFLGEEYRRLAVFALSRARGFPRLYYFDRPVGSGERIWRRFCAECEAGWLPLAERALWGFPATGEWERSGEEQSSPEDTVIDL